MARKQDRVIDLKQLSDLGVTFEQVRSLRKHGFLHRFHRGVYAYGDGTLTADGHYRAALLATHRDDAWLSGRTSAAVRKLRAFNRRGIEITVPTTGIAKRTGLLLRTTTVPTHEQDIRIERGLRISSVPLMLIELARRETREELERVIDLTVRKRMFDIDAMEATLVRRHGHPGTSQLLETTVAAYINRVDRSSGLEIAFDVYHAKHHPDIPDPERNVHLDRWELDCYWRAQNVVLELDGRPYHIIVRDRARDNVKNTWLATHDIRVLRVTDDEFELDPERAFRDLRILLKLPRITT